MNPQPAVLKPQYASFVAGCMHFSSAFPGTSNSQTSRQHLQASQRVLRLVWNLRDYGKTQGCLQKTFLKGGYEQPVGLDQDGMVSLFLSFFLCVFLFVSCCFVFFLQLIRNSIHCNAESRSPPFSFNISWIANLVGGFLTLTFDISL